MKNRAEQYYPTYVIDEYAKEAILLEFEEAQKLANGQTRIYGQVTSILIAVLSLVIPFLLRTDQSISIRVQDIDMKATVAVSLIITFFGAILLRYFVELQKQITINARKVITLRAFLKVDYGSIHLTLPNNRVEGASNPFLIKFFNGWTRFETTPFWILVFGVNIIWWHTFRNGDLSFYFGDNELSISLHVVIFIISYFYFLVFRTQLYDRHESYYLGVIKFLAWLCRLEMKKGFEEIIYHAKLAYIELDRLGVDYENLKDILISVEDQTFYKNRGYSIKSLIRAFLSQIPRAGKKYGYIRSGGSTITMQLIRSLFIPTTENRYKRKIFEILFSVWINRQFSKGEILKLYVSSVRYEKGVIGLSSAINYFFSDIKSKKLSKEEGFFLVERLSNITSTVTISRLDSLLKRTNAKVDNFALFKIYIDKIEGGILKSDDLPALRNRISFYN